MGSAEALQLAGRRLQGVYESDSTLRVVLDHFSTRSKNSDETTVDALQGALKQEGHSVEYGQAREALKKLAQATDSRFIRGRRGAKTRVHWKFSIIEMGKVARAHIGARGAARAPTRNGHNSERPPVPVFHHRFPMREDFIIELNVPVDMSLEEANRFSQSIQALAMKR